MNIRIASWSPKWVGVSVGTVLFVSILLTGSMLYKRGSDAIHQELQGNLIRTAKAGAGLVDGDLHSSFVSRGQESSAKYKAAISPLKRFHDTNPEIAYIYTVILDGDKPKFILDPTEEGDADEDGVDDKSHIGEVYEVSREDVPAMFAALTEQKAYADESINTDEWGTFISGYAPFFDSKGELAGVVGVDLAADDYTARLASFRKTGVVALFVLGLLSALAGLLASFYQRNSLLAKEQEESSRLELEELADSLDIANQCLRAASWRFEQLFNRLPIACFTFDADGLIYEWSNECKAQFGREAFEVVQRSMFDTIVSEENKSEFSDIINTVMSAEQVSDFEWADSNKHGANFLTVMNVFPLKGHDNQVTGGIAACVDITERQQMQELLQQKANETQEACRELEVTRLRLEAVNAALTSANEKLELMATIDTLTGLLNHGTISNELNNAISLAERHERPLSIVMMDVDDFKKLNDSVGHIAGDAVLKVVARVTQDMTRQEDVAGRYGGEEFLVILPETPATEAVQFAERLRKAIQEHSESEHKVTASFGVATISKKKLTASELIDRADQAMYRAKRDGKNRVVHDQDRDQDHLAA